MIKITSISDLRQFADNVLSKLLSIPDNLEFSFTVTKEEFETMQNDFKDQAVGLYQKANTNIPKNTLIFYYSGVCFKISYSDEQVSVWYKHEELEAFNNNGKHKEPREGEVAEITIPVKVIFNWSNKIVEQVDEHDNPTEYSSGWMMSVMPQQGSVYKGQAFQSLFMTVAKA